MASDAAATTRRGPLTRLDHLGSGWLLVGSLVVLVALLVAVVGAQLVLAPDLRWDVVDVGDDFDGPVGPLQDRGPEHPWQLVGEWEAGDGTARATQLAFGQSAVAVVDLTSADGVISATAADLVEGWGFVFRYHDVANHWQLLAAPERGGWVLLRVVDGIALQVAQAPIAEPVPTSDAEVAVRMDGSRIGVQLDGAEVLSHEAEDNDPDGTSVGLLATRLDPAAGWSRFDARAAIPR
jgi:hypothetical protein